MHIVIQRDDGQDVEFHIHPNGSASVRVNGKHLGHARWEKNDNIITLDGLPQNTLHEPEPEAPKPSGLSFEFEEP